MKHFLLSLTVAALTATTTLSANTQSGQPATIDTNDKVRLARLHIPFIENVGQADSDIAFYTNTFGGAVVVKKHGKLELVVPLKKKAGHAVIGEAFVDAKVKAIKGNSPAAARVSYYLGNDPEAWHSGIPTYETVAMGGLYDGIDLELKAYGNNVEKLFYVKPGADPKLIRVKVSGTRSVEVTEDGFLELETNDCIVHYSVPIAYQVIDNEKRSVEVAYSVSGDTYGFTLGGYDTSKELVIDPLLQSTYFGGSGGEAILDLGVAPNGSIFAVGRTSSTDISGFASSLEGTDAFVARFNPSLRELQGVAYIGGTPGSGNDDLDEARTLAFRTTGDGNIFDVYVAGWTQSPDLAGVVDNESADFDFGDGATGEYEGYVSWLNSDLTQLHRSTYFGGSTSSNPGVTLPTDAVDAMAVSAAGDIFIAGTTFSNDIPGTAPTSAQPNPGGGAKDGFVARLAPDLTSITAATYLGGGGDDEAIDLFLGATHAFVAGHTSSADFPVTAGSFQEAHGGGFDVFISKITLSLSANERSTYIGGTVDENLKAIADTGVDDLGSFIYLTGHLPFFSGTADFPLVNTAIPGLPAQEASFIAYIQKDLITTSAFQGAYLGGDGDTDEVRDIAVLPEGIVFNIATDSVYVTGVTNSSDFPGAVGGDDPTADTGGLTDAFVLRIDATLTNDASYRSTYLGGDSANEDGNAVAVNSTSDVYVSGTTESTLFPGITITSADSDNSDGGDGFIARFDPTLDAASLTAEIHVVPTLIDFGEVTNGGTSAVQDITIRNLGDPATADDLIISGIELSDPNSSDFQIDLTRTDSSCGSAAVNFVVKPEENCLLWVTFTPQTGSSFPFEETLIISSNDFNERMVSVALTGTGGTDSDGVPDLEEMGPDGLNGQYDGNLDGTPDLEQASVASLHSHDDAFYVTIEVIENGLSLENVTATSNPTTADLPTNVQTPYGYYSFSIIGLANGGTATVRFVLNSTGTKVLTGDENPDAYWKFGKETPAAADETWYQFAYDGVNGAQINTNEVTLSFTDGSRGDRDLTADGRIVDPGAPVKARTVTITPVADDGSSGVCFIATAAYGSYMHHDVKVLRDFRDEYLLTNSIGRELVSLYYQYSPPLANYIREDETRRAAARWLLTPLVYGISYPYLALLLAAVASLMVAGYRRRGKSSRAD